MSPPITVSRHLLFGIVVVLSASLLCPAAFAQQDNQRQPTDGKPTDGWQVTHMAGIGGKLGEFAQRTRLTALVSDQRLVFMVWSNVSGSGGGSGSSDTQGGYRMYGFHKAPDGTQLIIEAETEDGVTGTVRVGDREFETPNINVVLAMRIRGQAKNAVYEYRQIQHNEVLDGPLSEGLLKLGQKPDVKAFFK